MDDVGSDVSLLATLPVLVTELLVLIRVTVSINVLVL